MLKARLNHIVDYIATLASVALKCSQIDEEWIQLFRAWSAKRPVVFTSGRVRDEPRAASTIENSVIQLAAAINRAFLRHDISMPPQFRPIQTKELNQTPARRLSVTELAEAFRYAIDPRFPVKRRALHHFLIASVATAARPDAIADISTRPERRQWNKDLGVLALNPKGRRQTKKRRAIVMAPWQFASHLNSCDGFFVPVKNVSGAWDSMCQSLGWAKDRESGPKLIRRSIAQLLRDPKRMVPTEQIELQLGHRSIDSVTDLYAAFDPAYLAACTQAIEGIINQIESLCPGAFHRKDTGTSTTTIPARSEENG